MSKKISIIIFVLISISCLGQSNRHDSYPNNFYFDVERDSISMYLLESEKLLDSLPQVAFQKADKARKLAIIFNMDESEAFASILLGELKSKSNEYYSAKKFFNTALRYYKNSNNHKILAKIHFAIGKCDNELKDYNASIDHYTKAATLYKSFNMLDEYIKALQNIGEVYHRKGEYDKAKEFYVKALNINLDKGNHNEVAELYQNLGNLFYLLKDDSLAIYNFNKSIEFYKECHDLKNIGIVYSNIGIVNLGLSKAPKALKNFEKSLVYFTKTGYEYGKMWAFNNIGTSLVLNGNLSEAEQFFKRSLETAKSISSQEGILINYKDLFRFYENRKEFKDALDYYKKYTILNDSLNRQNSDKQISELQQLYLIESREKDAIKNNSEEKQLKTRKYSLIGFISLFLLTTLVVISTVYNKKGADKRLTEHKSNLEKLVEKRTKELQVQISERKIAEESDQLKSAFLANMSHELRTPMNAIIAFSNFLREPELNAGKRMEYLDHILAAGDSLLRLIDDIIDIAKIESKQIKMFIQPTNISRLLCQIYEFYNELRGKNNKKHIRFNLNIEDDFSYIINTDSQRLKQVLSNLIDNAFKYTEKGEIKVGFETTENSVAFYVSDTGIGIPKDKQDEIFSRFYQLNVRKDRRLSGTGLGLAICVNLVKLLGGKLSVESEFEKGSKFKILLPVESVKKQPNPKVWEQKDNNTKPETVRPSYNWHNITILIAEDEDLNYKVLDSVLTRTKAHLIRAKDGISAVEICRNQKVDLVLMDVQMPGMDGYEATQEIKKLNNRTPVIAQTSFAMTGEKEKCLKSGCDDFISKPLNIQDLLKKIEHFIR